MGTLTRRHMMTTLAAGAVAAGTARAQAPAGDMLAVRGTRLYVEDTGPKDARAARILAASGAPAAVLWGKFGEVGGQLGAHRDDLYTHQPALHDFFGKMIAASGLPNENWARGGHQQSLLNADPALFEDHRPLLARLKMPSVLFKGSFDHVTSVEQIEAMAAAPGARPVRFFANSSHFVHVEEPDAYAAAVRDIVAG